MGGCVCVCACLKLAVVQSHSVGSYLNDSSVTIFLNYGHL